MPKPPAPACSRNRRRWRRGSLGGFSVLSFLSSLRANSKQHTLGRVAQRGARGFLVSLFRRSPAGASWRVTKRDNGRRHREIRFITKFALLISPFGVCTEQCTLPVWGRYFGWCSPSLAAWRMAARLRLITFKRKALSKLRKESRPCSARGRCNTRARRRDETSISTSVSPQPAVIQ